MNWYWHRMNVIIIETICCSCVCVYAMKNSNDACTVMRWHRKRNKMSHLKIPFLFKLTFIVNENSMQWTGKLKMVIWPSLKMHEIFHMPVFVLFRALFSLFCSSFWSIVEMTGRSFSVVIVDKFGQIPSKWNVWAVWTGCTYILCKLCR